MFSEKDKRSNDLEMTPMVDISFLLLIFFVVTASFQLQKAVSVPNHLSQEPSLTQTTHVENDRVELHIDEQGSFLVLASGSEIEPLGKQALIRSLRTARTNRACALMIKVQRQAPLQLLVDGMDSGSIAGFDDIQVNEVAYF